jgi:hypothetical protein
MKSVVTTYLGGSMAPLPLDWRLRGELGMDLGVSLTEPRGGSWKLTIEQGKQLIGAKKQVRITGMSHRSLKYT